MMPFFVYMLRCTDASYYCGQTDDIASRLEQHYAGEIAYTSTRKPVQLVWQGEFESREVAIAFEQQIKGWSRAKKEALIAGDWDRIQQLAKSKSCVPANSQSCVRPEPVEGLAGLRQALPERSKSYGQMERRLAFEPVVAEDFEALAALREAALRQSLEWLGLFSQERSRERLRSNFRPAFMRHIVCDDQRVGLLSLWPEGDALKLQHLYLAPQAQGQGIGAWVLKQVKAEARALGRDVKLEALPQSDANRFYQRHGFVKVGEAEFDVFYMWPVQQGAVA